MVETGWKTKKMVEISRIKKRRWWRFRELKFIVSSSDHESTVAVKNEMVVLSIL